MAQPALVGLMVGILTWQALTLAGNDMVTNAADVSSRTSVAVLAVMKESRHWIGLALGSLVYLWAWQAKKLERPSIDERTMISWSAALPQWRPRPVDAETAVFLVPATEIEAESAEPASLPAPSRVFSSQPSAATPKPPSIAPAARFRDMEHLAERFMAARQASSPGGGSLFGGSLSVTSIPGGGLVRAEATVIPANLGVEKLAGLPRTEFESLAGEYYRRQGYNVAALGSSDGSAAIDLILQRPNEVVVVKCLTGDHAEVPINPVRELLAMVMAEGATRGILLTAARFSRKAVKFAHQKGRNRLELIDGRQFAAMLKSASAGSPACPCCQGAMAMAPQRKRFRKKDLAWTCLNAPRCSGSITAGDLMKQRARVQQKPALVLR